MLRGSITVLVGTKRISFITAPQFILNPSNPLKYSKYLMYKLKRDVFNRLKFKRQKMAGLGFSIYAHLVLHVHITRTNIFITLATLTGNTVFKVTPRQVGFTRRGLKTRHFVVTKLGYRVVTELYRLAMKIPLTLRVYFYKSIPIFWTNQVKRQFLEIVMRATQQYIFFKVVKDIAYICHNGCRRPKQLHKRRGRVRRSWKKSSNAKRSFGFKYYQSFLTSYHWTKATSITN